MPDSGVDTWATPVPIMVAHPGNGFMAGQMAQVNPIIINSRAHAEAFREEDCSSCLGWERTE